MTKLTNSIKMSNQLILAFLEISAILSCGYGMYTLYLAGSSIIGIIYSGLWFIMGFFSNLFGLLALYYTNYGGEDDDNAETSQYFSQHHYFLAWLTIVVGYPSFVTQAWMVHYPSNLVHLHILLSLVPMLAFVQRKTKMIVRATQISTMFGILSHAYISYLVWNFWGLVGAGVMVLNAISLSMPTKYNLWGFTSREMYVMGLAATSYIFCLATTEASANPIHIKELFPFYGVWDLD